MKTKYIIILYVTFQFISRYQCPSLVSTDRQKCDIYFRVGSCDSQSQFPVFQSTPNYRSLAYLPTWILRSVAPYLCIKNSNNAFQLEFAFSSESFLIWLRKQTFLFVCSEALTLLESKWPVNSLLYYIKNMKPKCLRSSESQRIAIWEHCGVLVVFLSS